MKALLAASALCVSLAIAVPLSLAQTTQPPMSSTTTQSTTMTTPSTTMSPGSTSTTPMQSSGSQMTTTTSTSTTTTSGSCHTRHADGQACSCRKAPMTMGTAQSHRCMVGGQ